jgi:glycosyltransferase involved in cell wall biosynthesis
MSHLLSDADIAAARSRETFASACHELLDSMTSLTAGGLEPPTEQAGYYHDFFCRTHGVALAQGPHADHFQCPVTGHLVTGEPYRSARLWFENHRLSQAAYQAALCYRLLGSDHGLRVARQILSAYSGRYGQFPESKLGGRLTYQSLDEAAWLLPIAWTADLVRPGVTAGELDDWGRQLLAPAASLLSRWSHGEPQNMQCWRAAAIHAVGVVLQDQTLVSRSLSGPEGLLSQLKRGVDDDGWWCEGSPAYHFFALWPILSAARLAPELRLDPALARMLEAPLALARGDLSLPTLNNCWPNSTLAGDVVHGVPRSEAFYELGYAWFRRPAFAWLLRTIYRSRPRHSIESLLYGRTLFDSDWRPKRRSFASSASGLGVLRSGQDHHDAGELQAVLKFGSRGGIHDHADKLSISVCWRDISLCRDFGSSGYGDTRLTAWYRSTPAHNTLVVDEQDQPYATGKVLSFRPGEGRRFGLLAAEISWDLAGSYRGVRARRILLQTNDYLIDLVSATAPTARTFDLIQHLPGRPEQPGEPAMAPGAVAPYAHLAGLLDVRGPLPGGVPGPEPLCHDAGGASLAYFIADPQPSETFLGSAAAVPAWQRRPVVVRRQVGTTALFVSVFHPHADQRVVHAVRASGEAARTTIAVQHTRSCDTWTVDIGDELQVALVSAGPGQASAASHRHRSTRAPVIYDIGGTSQYSGPLGAGLRRLGAQVVSLSPGDFTATWLARAKRPSVLHLHFPHYFFTAGDHAVSPDLLRQWANKLRQARAAGRAIVWTAHNLYPHENGHAPEQHDARVLLCGLATGIIAHCSYAAAEVRKRFAPNAPVTVIPHGGYADRYEVLPGAHARTQLGITADARVFLHFGILRRYKGTLDLIRAFRALPLPHARLIIAGEPWSRGEGLLEQIERACQEDPRIDLIPRRITECELPAYFAAADYVVMPYTDILTSGNVPLAHSLRRPIIAPRIGCLPEMADPGAALLYDPAAPDSLASTLKAACQASPERAWRDVPDWDTIAEQTLEVYLDAVARAEGQRGGFSVTAAGEEPGPEPARPGAAALIARFFSQVLPARLASLEPISGSVELRVGAAGVWTVDTGARQVSKQQAFMPYMNWFLTPGDLQALLEGRLDPMAAFMSGRLRIKGDLQIAARLASLLQPLSAGELEVLET